MSLRRKPLKSSPVAGVYESPQGLRTLEEQSGHFGPTHKATSNGKVGYPTRPSGVLPHPRDQPSMTTCEAGSGRLDDELMSPNDIIIAVMGITGSGKTTFISRCMGEDVGIGHGLHSCTQDVTIHTFRHRGKVVRMIDTPGFDDTSKADVNILTNIAFWLTHAYRAKPKLLLSGIIYLHPVSEQRMAGTAMKNLEMMKRLCGTPCLASIWLATTMWGCVPPAIGEQRERELITDKDFWAGLIREGSKVRRHGNSDVSAFAIIDDIITRGKPVVLSIQREMVDECKSVDETDAGRYLRRNVINEQQKVQQRLARSADELEEQLAAQDAAEVDEVLERQRRYQAQIEEKSRSLTAMQLDMEALRTQKAEELAQREEEFAREKKQQEERMEELNRQIQQLQTDRDEACRRAEKNAQQQPGQAEDPDLLQAIQKDYAAIAALDRMIAERQREEEQAAYMASQVVKQESVFRKTLKVSMAQSLVACTIQGVVYMAQQGCVVM